MKRTNSIAPLVLGIIGGVFAIIGGACVTVCADVATAVTGSAIFSIMAYLSLAAGIAGLIGGCISRKNGFGSVLMLIAAAVEIVCTVFLGFIWSIVVGLVLFTIGGIIGLVKHD